MDSIAGIGVDVVEVDRIRKVTERHGERFLGRIYAPEERARAAELADPAIFLAGRFAAKEAVLKVLGTGASGGVAFRDVTVLREPSGRPAVVLSGRGAEVARALGIARILVSISHTGRLAVAQAVGVG
ncbi:MAG: holo-ACP synthase [Planctomycetes bacterium]|nr:holo-ACP synthase [Planctomycetota bacterium]